MMINLDEELHKRSNTKLEELFQQLLVLEKNSTQNPLPTNNSSSIIETINYSTMLSVLDTISKNSQHHVNDNTNANNHHYGPITRQQNTTKKPTNHKRHLLKSSIRENYSHSFNTTSLLGHIVIFGILVLLMNAQSTCQESSFCPKACICDEQKLETICKESIGTTGLPHTLNPNTVRIIVNNGQTTILNGLDYYTKLQTLDLAHNKISFINFADISKNENLIIFNTSHNNIDELKDRTVTNALSELSSSTTSTLFTDFQPSDVKDLKNLPKINVIEFVANNNHLMVLKNFTFMRWHKLQKLDLSYNSLYSLETYSLFGLNQLEMLNLKGNHLMQVPSIALRNTVLTINNYRDSTKPASMKYLDLSENQLKLIESGSFSSLINLKELYLETCSLTSIHMEAFYGLKNLNSLSLDKNLLLEVPSHSFKFLDSLRSLKINANQLIRIGTDSFSDLFNLEELQLNNGDFKELQKGVFNGLHSLKRLDLSQNSNLKYIELGCFKQLSKLTSLNLQSCKLTTLEDDFNSSFSSSLLTLNLKNNPLYCSCELKWMTRWLKKVNETSRATLKSAANSNMSRLNIDESPPIEPFLNNDTLNLTCSGPPALLGKYLIELPENKFECLNPSSKLNVHIGFATLFFISFIMSFVCAMNFFRNKQHLFVMLKENLVQRHMSIVLPYSQNLHKNVDNLKKETQLYGPEYEHIDHQSTGQIYTIPGEQVMYYGHPPQNTSYFQHL